jgi:DNA-binding CsgD family transcriptional regulator
MNRPQTGTLAIMITSNSLQALFRDIANTKNEQELRQQVMASLGEYFVANRWKIMFFDELPIDNPKIYNLFKLAISTDHNPVLRYLVENHAAVHEELLLPPGMWEKICPRLDHGHVMAGPIVGDGRLLGAVGFTRHGSAAPFNSQNLTDLNALCLHLSTSLTTFRFRHNNQLVNDKGGLQKIYKTPTNPLTSREMEIAHLVAQGLTNTEIGKRLWITENTVKQALKRMFRKLEVSSRAAMVAKISRF